MNRMTALGLIAAAFQVVGTGAQAASVNAHVLPGELRRGDEMQQEVFFGVAPCATGAPTVRRISTAITPGALESLLEGYNYSAVWDEHGQLVRLILSGPIPDPDPRCHTAPANADVDSPSFSGPPAELLRYEPLPAVVPDRYRDSAPGSVRPVSLPLDELARMEPGDRLDLSLPDGRFQVTLENRYAHDNGDVTWEGRLSDEDSSHRIIITHGSGGSVGQVSTPDNTYGLEFEDGRNWLVDTGAGYPQSTME